MIGEIGLFIGMDGEKTVVMMMTMMGSFEKRMRRNTEACAVG